MKLRIYPREILKYALACDCKAINNRIHYVVVAYKLYIFTFTIVHPKHRVQICINIKLWRLWYKSMFEPPADT